MLRSLVLSIAFLLLILQLVFLEADEPAFTEAAPMGSVNWIIPQHQRRFTFTPTSNSSLTDILNEMHTSQKMLFDTRFINSFPNRSPIEKNLNSGGAFSYWSTIKAISHSYKANLNWYRRGAGFGFEGSGFELRNFVDVGPFLIGASLKAVNTDKFLQIWPLGIYGESEIIYSDDFRIRNVTLTLRNGRQIKISGKGDNHLKHKNDTCTGWQGTLPEEISNLKDSKLDGEFRSVISQYIWKVKANPGAKLQIGNYCSVNVSPKWERVDPLDENTKSFNPEKLDKPDNYFLRVRMKMNPLHTIPKQLATPFQSVSHVQDALLLPDKQWLQFCKLTSGKLKLEITKSSISLDGLRSSSADLIIDSTLKDNQIEVLFMHRFSKTEIPDVDGTGIEFTLNGLTPYSQPFVITTIE